MWNDSTSQGSTGPRSSGQVSRQAGLVYHSSIDEVADIVGSLAGAIPSGIERGRARIVPPLAEFNHAEWSCADQGRKFITPHRDPDTAGGVVAVLTIRGQAVFRIWDSEPRADAEGNPSSRRRGRPKTGDLVLMRGGGWPLPTSRVRSTRPNRLVFSDRVTLTLRKGGSGADHFA